MLAIAAARLGFGPVAAVDVDPVSLEAAKENAVRNGVELELGLADALSGLLPGAAVAVANVSLDVVGALGARLDVCRLVTSGYRDVDEPAPQGFELRERRTLEGWAGDLFERSEKLQRNEVRGRRDTGRHEDASSVTEVALLPRLPASFPCTRPARPVGAPPFR